MVASHFRNWRHHNKMLASTIYHFSKKNFVGCVNGRHHANRTPSGWERPTCGDFQSNVNMHAVAY